MNLKKIIYNYWKIIEEDIQYILNSDVDFQRFENSTVLITGANGMLASYIVMTLLYLNKNIVTSEGVLNHQAKSLNELKERIEHNIDYYEKNELIKTSFNFLNKIIDIWYTNSI